MQIKWPMMALLLACVTACSYNQMYFRLNPTLHTAQKVIGQKERIAVVVIDQRPRPYLGIHWLGLGAANKINLADDLSQQTAMLLKKAIRDRGFRVAENQEVISRRLFVRLLDYTFEQSLALLGTTVTTTMTLSATAQNGPDEYTKQYKAVEKRDIIPSTESQKEFRQLTRVYEASLNQMLADPNIWLTFTHKNANEVYQGITHAL